MSPGSIIVLVLLAVTAAILAYFITRLAKRQFFAAPVELDLEKWTVPDSADDQYEEHVEGYAEGYADMPDESTENEDADEVVEEQAEVPNYFRPLFRN